MNFCYITELTNAIRPGFNLLRDINLNKTAGTKGSSKVMFALNGDFYASISKLPPGSGKKYLTSQLIKSYVLALGNIHT